MNSSTHLYVTDTWGHLHDAASWCFDASSVHAWPEDALHRLYRVLNGDGRISAVHIESGDFRAGDVHDLEPAFSGITAAEALAHIRAFKGSMGTVSFELELMCYARETPGSPPRLMWVGEGTEAVLTWDSAPMDSMACLNLGHTLFRPRSTHGLENDELYHLNAPILGGLLQRFEEEFGPLLEYEGTGVSKTGFYPYSTDVYG